MNATTQRRGPLSRFRVIDLTRVRSGPTAVRQLADWGADVIKIETPPGLNLSDGWGGKRTGADFQNLHRNKRGFTLNLKDPDGLKIFKQLAETLGRGGRELPARREVPPRHRLRVAEAGQPAKSSSPASPASARPAPMPSVRASTRSRRAWAG